MAVFSPWASSDVNGLQREFLAALHSAFEDGQGQKYTVAKAALAKYSKVCTSSLEIIPVAGAGTAGAVQEGVDTATAGEPWHVEFDSAAIARYGKL